MSAIFSLPSADAATQVSPIGGGRFSSASPPSPREQKEGDTPQSCDFGSTSRETLTALLATLCTGSRARALSDKLMAHFGSLAAVLSASASALMEASGGKSDCVALLRAVQATLSRTLREPLEERPVFRKWSDLDAYLRLTLANETGAVARVLMLDRESRLIIDVEHARGCRHHVRLYPREILRRAIETAASGAIIVLGYPGAIAKGTDEDTQAALTLSHALHAVGVRLQDYILVGENGLSSFAAAQILPQAHIDV